LDDHATRRSRISPYWTCQIIGWSLQAILAVTIPTLYGGVRWPIIARAIVGTALGVVLTDQLRRHMRRQAWLALPLSRLIPRIAGACLTIAAVMVLAIMPFVLMFIPPPLRAGPITAIFAGHVAVIGVWATIYVGIHYLGEVRTAHAERLRLELAMRDTELRALRAQLNPHFLFNSLNSLRGLVTEDPARARDAITGLAALLRYSLQLSRGPMTTLEQELDATRRYLELEALRFEDRLDYSLDVDPRALEHLVPPMLVQTIVENAIKHGIAELPEGGVVRIEVRKRADDLAIRVTNTGALDRAREQRGIGLANAAERLRLLFGERATLELVASAPDEVSCDVIVPVRTNRALSGTPLTHLVS
jgi:hypothetical protein